jgi:catalase
MTETEREHIVAAFSFELGKCRSEEVKDRVLANLANVDRELTRSVAANLGKEVPKGKPARGIQASPMLSLLSSAPAPITGRTVAILAADGVDDAGVAALTKALKTAGAAVVVIAPHGGIISGESGSIAVDKSAMTTQSVEYDALIVAGGQGAKIVGEDSYAALNLTEAFRHYKPLAAWGRGCEVLTACGIPADSPGVVSGPSVNRAFVQDLIEAVGRHRHWNR